VAITRGDILSSIISSPVELNIVSPLAIPSIQRCNASVIRRSPNAELTDQHDGMIFNNGEQD